MYSLRSAGAFDEPETFQPTPAWGDSLGPGCRLTAQRQSQPDRNRIFNEWANGPAPIGSTALARDGRHGPSGFRRDDPDRSQRVLHISLLSQTTFADTPTRQNFSIRCNFWKQATSLCAAFTDGRLRKDALSIATISRRSNGRKLYDAASVSRAHPLRENCPRADLFFLLAPGIPTPTGRHFLH